MGQCALSAITSRERAAWTRTADAYNKRFVDRLHLKIKRIEQALKESDEICESALEKIRQENEAEQLEVRRQVNESRREIEAGFTEQRTALVAEQQALEREVARINHALFEVKKWRTQSHHDLTGIVEKVTSLSP